MISKKTVVTCALYEKLKMIFTLDWPAQSPLRIQLKMCSPSLRENFKESVYSL